MVAEGYSSIGYYIQFSSTIVFIVAGFSHVTSYYMQFCSTIVFMVAEVFFTLLVTIRSSVLHLCSWLMKFIHVTGYLFAVQFYIIFMVA